MIERLVVVGSGVMGRGIAYVGAVGGFQTTLVDIKQETIGERPEGDCFDF